MAGSGGKWRRLPLSSKDLGTSQLSSISFLTAAPSFKMAKTPSKKSGKSTKKTGDRTVSGPAAAANGGHTAGEDPAFSTLALPQALHHSPALPSPFCAFPLLCHAEKEKENRCVDCLLAEQAGLVLGVVG